MPTPGDAQGREPFNINNNYAAAQTNTSIRSAPTAPVQIVITSFVFSMEGAGSIKLVEDPAGTPVTLYGPYYFAANGGAVAIGVKRRLTPGKALGVTSTGAVNHSVTVEGYEEIVGGA